MISDYKFMPRRNGRSDGSLKNSIKFFTNYYEMELDPKKSIVYQYSFSLPEDIPQNSPLYNKAIFSLKRSILKDKIGYLAHSGQIIWGTIDIKIPTTIQCKFIYEQKHYQLQSMIKPTKVLNLKDLNQEETRPKLFQILNSYLKTTLKQLKLRQLGKPGQYFNKQAQDDKDLFQRGLKVIKGFRFTLAHLNSGIYVQIDVCSRVLQAENLLETFNGKPIDQIHDKYTGMIVWAGYGNCRTYKIEKIDYNKTPLSTFQNDKKGETMTFKDYYRDAYGLNVRTTKQPLLLVVSNIRKELKKDAKQLQQIKEYVYLIPEFVSLTGMTDEQRADHTSMKALAPYTKLSPTDRVKKCTGIIQKFNNTKGMIEIKQAKRMEGFCLSRPELKYAGGSVISPDERGNIKYRGVLKQPFNFTDWIFVYSQGKNSKRDDMDADDAVGLLIKAGQSYGIKFKNPGFLMVEGNGIQEWKQKIGRDAEKNGCPQIIVIYLNQWEQKYYGALKRYITNELHCPSQFIRKRTLTNQKGAMSAASKIAIQMNVKVGSTPWEVQKRHPYFKGKNLMYGAMSLSKGKKGYTLAFVGTINSECTKVFSDCKIGIKDKENIPVDTLEEIYVSWAKHFFQTNNKKVPDMIILYREGLSDKQAASQLPRMEIPALDNMVNKIGDKTGVKNYRPEIMIVTVNKKINSRYFVVGKQSQPQGKFPPEVFNPNSGSVVLEPMSSEDSYDFHLAAQYVTQGTCTPTLFKVAYDTSKMTQEALINFTFEQCFNYYNWEGAVRVPACLQCADKLSKLVSQYIQEDIVQDKSGFNKKHFFL